LPRVIVGVNKKKLEVEAEPAMAQCRIL